MRTLSPLLLLATACGSDLAEAERRQHALDEEVSQLEAEIGALKQTLGGAKGPGKRTKVGAAAPPKQGSLPVLPNTDAAHDLSGVLQVTVGREGTHPSLPEVSPPQPTTGCGFRVQLPGLRAISDFALVNRGLGKSGPLQLVVDGSALTPHAFPATYERACSGAFRHAGTVVLFSPPEGVDVSEAALEFRLDPRVGTPRGDDGTIAYWAYPGTTLTFTIEGEWDSAWGEPTLAMVAVAVGKGKVDYELGGQIQSAGGVATPQATMTGPPPWTIEVSVPTDGPYALVHGLTVGNADHALTHPGPP